MKLDGSNSIRRNTVLKHAFRNKALEEAVFYFNYTYTIGLGFCRGCPSTAYGFAAWCVFICSRNVVSIQVSYSVAESSQSVCVRMGVYTQTLLWGLATPAALTRKEVLQYSWDWGARVSPMLCSSISGQLLPIIQLQNTWHQAVGDSIAGFLISVAGKLVTTWGCLTP